MDVLLEARDLKKHFGAFRAVDGISLAVKKGEVLGFLGPNGAGKTTTMKMLTGFLVPTSGTAVVCGETVTTGSAVARRRIGYLPEGAPLYGDMTPESFLAFIAAAHRIEGDAAGKAVADAAAAVQLESVMDQRIETLSKGFKRRVGLAAAILHGPDVLILDEPTDGLDPNQKHEVRRLIAAMSAERAIVISTHILEEVEALCSRAVIINAGRVVADGTPSELKARSAYVGAVTMLVPAADGDAVAATVSELAGVAGVERAGEGERMRLTILAHPGAVIADAVGDLVAAKGWNVSQFSVDGGRLDDVFRTVTTGRAA